MFFKHRQKIKPKKNDKNSEIFSKQNKQIDVLIFVLDKIFRLETMATTQMKTPLNPRPYINELVGKKILVRLKWGMTYTGTKRISCASIENKILVLFLGFLVSVDQYMNVHLDKAVEYIDEQNKGPLGEVLIRCNNILYISGVDERGVDDNGME